MMRLEAGTSTEMRNKIVMYWGNPIPINKKKPMSQALINSIAYSFLGIGILVVAFILFELLTPRHNLRKEILDNKNVALAILAGFFMLAVAIIIASAIH